MQKQVRNFRPAGFVPQRFVQPALSGGLRFRLAGGHYGAADLHLKCAVEVQSKQQILPRLGAQFGQEQFHQKRRAEDLVELGLQLRA